MRVAGDDHVGLCGDRTLEDWVVGWIARYGVERFSGRHVCREPANLFPRLSDALRRPSQFVLKDTGGFIEDGVGTASCI